MINKLGFGMLRLPQTEQGEYDWDAIDEMVDIYLENGGRWFDTCYTYLDGASEEAVRRCVVERKERESFYLIEKLPGYYCRSYYDCERYLEEEQKRCGVEYFDVLMLHWLNEKHYAIAEKYHEFDFLSQMKAEGKAGLIGFSYHGDAALLDEILTAHPETDVVLIQINYLDWESAGIESRKCYETVMRHHKQIFVMEPVKGGTLAKIPKKAEELLNKIHPDWTPSDWALRFVQSMPGVDLCLSGMGEAEQIIENLRSFPPMQDIERKTLQRAADIIQGNTKIPCTGCGYCQSSCPEEILIPEYFRLYNELCRDPEDEWKILPVYERLAKTNGRASDCIACRRCERHCPQNIEISQCIRQASERFEAQ